MSDQDYDDEQFEEYDRELQNIEAEQQKTIYDLQKRNVEQLKSLSHKNQDKYQKQHQNQLKKYYKNPQQQGQKEKQTQYSKYYPPMKINNMEFAAQEVEQKNIRQKSKSIGKKSQEQQNYIDNKVVLEERNQFGEYSDIYKLDKNHFNNQNNNEKKQEQENLIDDIGTVQSKQFFQLQSQEKENMLKFGQDKQQKNNNDDGSSRQRQKSKDKQSKFEKLKKQREQKINQEIQQSVQQNDQQQYFQQHKSYVGYSGGFKIQESQINQYKNLKQQQEEIKDMQEDDYDNEQRKQDIFAKLGIRDDYEVGGKEIPESYLDKIDDQYIHSTKQRDVKQKVQTGVISELEQKRERLRQRREVLLGKSDKLRNVDMLASELAEDDYQRQQILQKKIEDPNDLLNEKMAKVINYELDDKNRNQKNNQNKDEFEYFYMKNKEAGEITEQEVKPFMEDLDQLINNVWENEKPELDIVERKLQEHRQRMKEVEQNYNVKKMVQSKNYMPKPKLYVDEDEEEQKFVEEKEELQQKQQDRIERDFEGLQLKEIEQKTQKIEQEQVQNQNQQKLLSLEEREEKRLRILKEMREIDREIDKAEKKENQPEKLLKASKKVFENEQYVEPKERVFQQQFQEYMIDKQIQKQEEAYREKMDFDKFDKYKQPEKYQKFQEQQKQNQQNLNQFPITHRAQKFLNDYDELEQEQMQYQLQKSQNNTNKNQKQGQLNQKRQKISEQKRLFKSLMQEKNERANKLKLQDEQFILKFLFQEIDQYNTKFVSKQEIYENIRNNQDAMVFFELNMDTFYIDIDRLQTKRQGLLNYEEFSEFLRDQPSLGKETLKAKREFLEKKLEDQNKRVQIEQEAQIRQEIGQGNCLLTQKEIRELQQIFDELDDQNSGFLQLSYYVKGVQEELRYLLNFEAVQYNGKRYSLFYVLQKVEQEIGQEEFISFKAFMEHFKNFKESEEFCYIVQEEYMMIIQDIFDGVNRVFGEYVEKSSFMQEVGEDIQVQAIKKESVLEGGMKIEEIFQRLDQQCLKYIDFQCVQYQFSSKYDELCDTYLGVDRLEQVEILKKQNEQVVGGNNRENYEQFQNILSVNQQQKQNSDNFNNNKQQQQQEFKQLNEIEEFNKRFQMDKYQDQYDNIDQQFFGQKRVVKIEQEKDVDLVTRQQLQEFDEFYKDLKKKKENENNLQLQQQAQGDQQGVVQKDEEEQVKDEKINNLKRYKVDYNSYFGKSKKGKSKKQATIPKGPNMLERGKKETIRDRKLNEFIMAKEEEEKSYFKFKANKSVSATTRLEKLESLKKKEEEKQNLRTQQLIQDKKLQDKQYEFTMYKIDKQKNKEEQENIRQKIMEEMEFYKVVDDQQQQEKNKGQQLKQQKQNSNLQAQKQQEQAQEEQEQEEDYEEDEEFEDNQDEEEEEEEDNSQKGQDIDNEDDQEQEQSINDDQQEEIEQEQEQEQEEPKLPSKQSIKGQKDDSINQQGNNKANNSQKNISNNNKQKSQTLANIMKRTQQKKQSNANSNNNKQGISNFFVQRLKQQEQQQKQQKQNDNSNSNKQNQNQNQNQNQKPKQQQQQNNINSKKPPIKQQQKSQNDKKEPLGSQKSISQNQIAASNKEIGSQELIKNQQEEEEEEEAQSQEQQQQKLDKDVDNSKIQSQNDDDQDDDDNNKDQESETNNQENKLQQQQDEDDDNQEQNDEQQNVEENQSQLQQQDSQQGDNNDGDDNQENQSQQDQEDNQSQIEQQSVVNKSKNQLQSKSQLNTSLQKSKRQSFMVENHPALDVSKMTKVQKMQWEAKQKKKEEEQKKKELEERKKKEKLQKEKEKSQKLREKLGVSEQEEGRKKLEEQRKLDALKRKEDEKKEQEKRQEQLKQKLQNKQKLTSKKLHGSSIMDKYRNNTNYGKSTQDVDEED